LVSGQFSLRDEQHQQKNACGAFPGFPQAFPPILSGRIKWPFFKAFLTVSLLFLQKGSA